MDRPHNPKGRAADLIKGLPPGKHFPQDDAKTKHITLLRVVTPWNTRQSKLVFFYIVRGIKVFGHFTLLLKAQNTNDGLKLSPGLMITKTEVQT